MKIVHINSYCSIYSTGKIVEYLYRCSSSAGDEVLVAYGNSNASEDINSYKINSVSDRFFNAMKARITGDDIHLSVHNTHRLVKKISEFSPDIIHLHNLHGYYIDIEILFNYLAKSKIPVVITLHDGYYFTGHCAVPYTLGCQNFINGCKECKYTKKYPKSLFFNNAEKFFNLKKDLFDALENVNIVTPSEWLAEYIGNSFLSKYPISVISNGIDRNIFKPSVSDFKKRKGLSEKFVIAAVATNWGKQKGYHVLLNLSELLPKNMHIVVVGVNKKQIETLPDNMTGIPLTHNLQELVDIYSSADVFINPTFGDTFSSVTLEALACGTPVITSDIGAPKEIIDEKCGIIVKSGDTEAFLEALIEIYNNPLDKEDCLKRASLFDKHIMAEKYKELYSHLIKNFN